MRGVCDQRFWKRNWPHRLAKRPSALLEPPMSSGTPARSAMAVRRLWNEPSMSGISSSNPFSGLMRLNSQPLA